VSSTEAVDLPWPCYGDVGDVDDDGDLDLFVSMRADGDAELLVNDGTGHFPLADRVTFDRPQGYASGVIADLDGDGDLDLASGALFVENQGFPTLPSHLQGWGDAGAGSWEHVAADVSGDGIVDLLEGGESMILVSVARP
jgi:hypothetical protein